MSEIVGQWDRITLRAISRCSRSSYKAGVVIRYYN